jgi:AraC-like DNA-binding protein
MDYAKNLLKSDDFSIAEIATLCGYAEPCHFSREFTKRVEIPPSQYEKQ